MREVPLPGGFATTVVRVGDTVRRTPSDRAELVHQLLALFEQRGWDGAPRFLGIDARGREILSFLEGHVGWERVQPPSVWSDESLARVAELVRQFHDLTAGVPLAGDQEVVCHNDLSPKNTIYRDLGRGLRPVAFLDWDRAAPGRRVDDIAFMCLTYIAPGPGAPVAAAVRGMRLLCDAYGLVDRSQLVETILGCQERGWREIQAAAEAGEPGGLALRDAGVIADAQDGFQWIVEHRHELEAGLG
jgi:aminoglycoside phosphotransferase (APT) family kinase protein